MGPKPSDTNMLAMPIMMAIINVAFLRPIFSFTSAVRIFVSKKLNRDEMTANTAQERSSCLLCARGQVEEYAGHDLEYEGRAFLNVYACAEGGGDDDEARENSGKGIGKAYEQSVALQVVLLGMFAPRVMKRLQPMPTENSTCVTASANTLTVNLLKSGSR